MKRQNPRCLCLALVLGGTFLGVLHAQTVTYTTFSVPEAAPATIGSLNVKNINVPGVVVGYLTDTSGNEKGWMRDTDGTITLLVDPLDTTTPSATEAYGISNNGTITGFFFDTAANLIDGFIYNAGVYVTHNVPGQPPGTDTVIGAINNNGRAAFCGFVLSPPYTTFDAFVSIKGVVTVFAVNGSSTTECLAINDSDVTAGSYLDSSGVTHGWTRDSSGTVTTIDVPAAATVPGNVPCLGTAAGTTVEGINDKGYISGHYFDKSYNEHGFVRAPGGRFIKLDVPGANQTAGGGINNAGVTVGHWSDTSCNNSGFIATLTK